MKRFQPCLSSGILASTSLLFLLQTRGEQSVEAWAQRYNEGAGARAVAVDGSGNAYVTGPAVFSPATTYEYATVAYSSAGVALWTNRYSGPGNDHQAQAVAVDGIGHVYVTGYSRDAGGHYNYATIAYSSGGVGLWTNRFGGSAGGDDYPQAIATDGVGHVYVTGYARDIGSGWDYATIAYSSAGVALWTNLYDGPTNSDDEALAMAVDGSGNVYVTGISSGANYPVYDYATIAYSSAGVPLWTNRYNGPGDDNDEPIDVAVDATGIVYVTGSSVRSVVYPYEYYDWTTIAYSSTGVPLWTNRYDNGQVAFGVKALAVGGGNVYLTGSPLGGGGGYTTIAYSSAGMALWTNHHEGPVGGGDAQAVAVDGTGNVIVTGSTPTTNGYPTDYRFETIKYSGAGVPLWTNRHDSHGPPQNKYCLALGPDGSAYVTGGSADFTTVKYVSVPELTITLTGTNTTMISWPFPSLGFELQQNTALNAANWASPPEPVSSNSTVKFIIANPAAGNRFYRLIHP